MIHDVLVTGSALKHGFTPDDVECAWCNCVHDVKRESDNSIHVRMGCDTRGNMVEMIGEWHNAGGYWEVFHAMAPRDSLIKFCGLEKRNAH